MEGPGDESSSEAPGRCRKFVVVGVLRTGVFPSSDRSCVILKAGVYVGDGVDGHDSSDGTAADAGPGRLGFPMYWWESQRPPKIPRVPPWRWTKGAVLLPIVTRDQAVEGRWRLHTDTRPIDGHSPNLPQPVLGRRASGGA